MDEESVDVRGRLATLPLFGGMTKAELDRLARGCQLRRLAVNEMVFRVGEPCRVLHVALEGQIKLFAGSSSGQEKVIELIGPGHSFAEAMMFTERPYYFNAQALAPTLLLTVPKANVLAGISRDCRFAMRMLAGLSSRLQGLLQDVTAYALNSGPQRVIGYLLRDHDAAVHPDPITVPLPVRYLVAEWTTMVAPHFLHLILTVLPATFSSAMVYFAWHDWHVIFIAALRSPARGHG